MTGKTFATSNLLSRLPQVRGKLLPSEALAPQTWFRVGGPAEVLFRPVDENDLAQFLRDCPADVPVTTIGVASNLLVRDGGVPGVVVRLGPQFALTKVDGAFVTAGAAALDVNVAKAAQAAGLAGLEFLCGIPGAIGGGLRMNAGAYGREFKDIMIEAHAVDRQGQKHVLTNAQMGFHYRHTSAPDDLIFTSARFEGEQGDPALIQTRMDEIRTAREATQPIREKTGGSTFANPDGHKSWQLIEAAGCRGLTIGGAQMSEKHCNFLINTGNATATDIEKLGEEVRRRVKATSGTELRWEIRRIGNDV